MRMTVTASGGWAGLVLGACVDLDELPADEAAAVVDAVASLEAVPAPVNARARDVRVYAFTVDDGRRAEAQETADDPRVRMLLDVVRSSDALMR